MLCDLSDPNELRLQTVSFVFGMVSWYTADLSKHIQDIFPPKNQASMNAAKC